MTQTVSQLASEIAKVARIRGWNECATVAWNSVAEAKDLADFASRSAVASAIEEALEKVKVQP